MAAAVAAVFAPAAARARPTCCSPRPAPGSARPWPISRRRRCGRSESGGTVWVSTFTKALQRQLDAEGARLFADPAERAQADRHPQGPRELSLPAQPRRRDAGRLCRPGGDPRPAGRALGRLHPRRRHGRRRLARLAAEPVPPGRRDGADRPARRMRLCRLPALPPLLHRARRAGRARGRPRHRQPCAGDGQCRARARETAADAGSCSTRAIICSTPPIRPSRRRSAGRKRSRCGAGSSARKAARAGRRRGLAARLMDVASYDEEGAQALEAAVEAARALPSDGWLARLAEGEPFGPVEALLAEVRGTVYARAKAQEAGYGLETELAEPDGALVEAAAPALEALEPLHKPLAALGAAAGGGARGRARLARSARRGRGSKARSAASPGGARRSPPGSRCSARIGGAADPDFVDWLAIERVEGREYDVGHPPPLARPDPAAGRGGAGAGARRAGDLGDPARRRRLGGGRGADRRRSICPAPPIISRPPARSTMPPASEVLIVTDISRATSPRSPAPMPG